MSLAVTMGQGRPASHQREMGMGPVSAEAGVSRDSPAPTAGQFFLFWGQSRTHCNLLFHYFLSKYDFGLTKAA